MGRGGKRLDRTHREVFKYGRRKDEKFNPKITIRCFNNHPRFPKAMAVFTATAQKKFDEPEQTHLVVISHRTVPREEHEKESSREQLSHLYSETLGGTEGNFNAYLYRSKFTENNISDRHYLSTSKEEVFTRLRDLLTRRTVPFEPTELHRLVHRMKL